MHIFCFAAEKLPIGISIPCQRKCFCWTPFRAAIQTSISTSVGLCHFRVGIKMQCGAFRSVACSSNWTTLWSETLLSQNSKLCIHSGLLHQIQSSERFPCHLVGAKVRSSFVAAHGLEDGCNVASSGQATGSTFQSPAINQGAPWRVKSWHSNSINQSMVVHFTWFVNAGEKIKLQVHAACISFCGRPRFDWFGFQTFVNHDDNTS